MRLHHVQVAGPTDCEAAARDFYVDVLGMTEIPKPTKLAARGGAWFRAGSCEIHVGIETPFVPAQKAHPGIAVADVRALAEAIEAAGTRVTWDDAIPGIDRFHTFDPMGNRLEFLQA